MNIESAARLADVRGVTVTDDDQPIWATMQNGSYDIFVDGTRVTSTTQDLIYPMYVPAADAVAAMQLPDEGMVNNDVILVSLDEGAITTVYDKPGQCRFIRIRPGHRNELSFVHTTREGMSIKIVDIETGAVRTLVSAANIEGYVTGYAWHPEGDGMVLEDGAPYSDSELRYVTADADAEPLLSFENGTASLGGGEAGRVGNQPGCSLWNARGLLFAGGEKDTAALGVVDRSGEYEWLVDTEFELVPVSWVDDSTAAFVEKRQGETHLKLVRDGQVEVRIGDGVTDLVRWQTDETPVVIRKSDCSIGDLWVGNQQRTTGGTYGDTVIAAKKLVYEADDGTHIPALYYKAPGTAGDSRPAVVYAHGGVHTRNLATFDLIQQALTHAGISVLAPDYRGSSGYGRAFAHANDAKMGVADLDDLVVAAEFLTDLGHNRIGIYGESWGGYYSLLAATQRDSFDAAVGIPAATDLERAWKSERLALARQKFGVMSHRDVDILSGRSPINYAENVDIPVFVIHGEDDASVPVEHSRSFCDRLDAHAIPYEVTIYNEEGHIIQSPSNRADMTMDIVQFFDRTLS